VTERATRLVLSLDVAAMERAYLTQQVTVTLQRQDWVVALAGLKMLVQGMPAGDHRASVVLQDVCEQLGVNYAEVAVRNGQ
jgi:hypothetical protein